MQWVGRKDGAAEKWSNARAVRSDESKWEGWLCVT